MKEDEEDSLSSLFSSDEYLKEKVAFSITFLAVFFTLRNVTNEVNITVLNLPLIRLLDLNFLIFGITIYFYALYFIPYFQRKKIRRLSDLFYSISVLFPLLVATLFILQSISIWALNQAEWFIVGIKLQSETTIPILFSIPLYIYLLTRIFESISNKSEESIKRLYLREEENTKLRYKDLSDKGFYEEAVFEAVKTIELRLQKLMYEKDIPLKLKTLGLLSTFALKYNIIREEDYNILRKLIRARNNIAHRRVEIRREEAKELIGDVEYILKRLGPTGRDIKYEQSFEKYPDRKRKNLSSMEKEEIRRLIRDGYSTPEIVRQIGCAKTQVAAIRAWIKRHQKLKR